MLAKTAFCIRLNQNFFLIVFNDSAVITEHSIFAEVVQPGRTETRVVFNCFDHFFVNFSDMSQTLGLKMAQVLHCRDNWTSVFNLTKCGSGQKKVLLIFLR